MTLATLVERERRHLRAGELATGAMLGIGAIALVVGLGAMSLARARWMQLPRATPFVVWALGAAALLTLALYTRRRLARRSRRDVALAIEHEQGLRRGVLVGALELKARARSRSAPRRRLARSCRPARRSRRRCAATCRDA